MARVERESYIRRLREFVSLFHRKYIFRTSLCTKRCLSFHWKQQKMPFFKIILSTYAASNKLNIDTLITHTVTNFLISMEACRGCDNMLIVILAVDSVYYADSMSESNPQNWAVVLFSGLPDSMWQVRHSTCCLPRQWTTVKKKKKKGI